MVEWSRLLDFFTETDNTCSGVFKTLKTGSETARDSL
jgi:hypothetical protein